MYRTAVNRLFLGNALGGNGNYRLLRSSNLKSNIVSSLFSTTVNPQSSISTDLNPNQHETPNPSDSTSSSSRSWSTSSTAGEYPRQERQRPRVDYQEEEARVLQASLRHVVRKFIISPISDFCFWFGSFRGFYFSFIFLDDC